MQDYGLGSKVVCVTGGASGIGLAAVKALLADGAKVAILDLQREQIDRALSDLADEDAQRASRLLGIAVDIRDAGALKKAADEIESKLGPVFGIIASAGISGAGKSEHLPEDEFVNVMSVNVIGMFLCCREFGARMIARGQGSIVAIGSIDGLGGQPGRTHYVTSKFAVTGMTKNLALEWGRHGVRVNCIAPTFVDTPMLRRNVPAAFVDGVVADRTPMGRMARAEEIASVAIVFLTDAMTFVTGTILPVDGGLSAGFVTAHNGADLSSNRLLEAGAYQA
ncbi:SDR family oxidoreductase [Sphingomonas sp. MG17]|uniref:SDR family oxidoreductase n=1 Tax=Sphingomonas tagetis TaxID=2949092 RepID=A0A9X2KL69_9SPHN|nr:SDR family NAD(P)-dependent oxidoreductase [Sphingomonas tagetis]MCP3730332.1 SDR family oxidoreductase [Sphingomonas tagetis]